MSKKTVRRRDITLSEEREIGYGLVGAVKDFIYWNATFSGGASSGESVVLSRTSKSAGEALLLLEEALNEQGYEVRG